MSSTWGTNIKMSIFGGSHTGAIGVVLDNLPANEKIDLEAVRVQMARRAPGQDKTATTRVEADEPQILSGLLDGVTTGAPLAAIIYNTNTRSKDYSDLKVHPRPGHADYTAAVRYDGANDIRGGGHFPADSPRVWFLRGPFAVRFWSVAVSRSARMRCRSA